MAKKTLEQKARERFARYIRRPRDKQRLVQLTDQDPTFGCQTSIFKLPHLEATEKLVYLVLKSYATQEGVAFPSMQKIADDASISVRTAQDTIQSLAEKGLIEIERRYDHETKQWTSSKYTLKSPTPILRSLLSNQDGQSDASHAPGVPQSLHQGGEMVAPGVPQSLHQGGEMVAPGVPQSLHQGGAIVADKIDQLVDPFIDHPKEINTHTEEETESEKRVRVLDGEIVELCRYYVQKTGDKVNPDAVEPAMRKLVRKWGVSKVRRQIDVVASIEDRRKPWALLVKALEHDWFASAAGEVAAASQRAAGGQAVSKVRDERYAAFYELFPDD